MLLLLVDHFGMIHDTIKSTTVATGIEKINLISELERVFVKHVKSMNSPLKAVMMIYFLAKNRIRALYLKRREIFKVFWMNILDNF